LFLHSYGQTKKRGCQKINHRGGLQRSYGLVIPINGPSFEFLNARSMSLDGAYGRKEGAYRNLEQKSVVGAKYAILFI
jgi:hypothetical protein